MNYTPSLPHIKALNLVREKCPLFLLSWLPGSAVLAFLLPNFWRSKGQGHSYCSVVHYVYLGETMLTHSQPTEEVVSNLLLVKESVS